ncbi:MAG TPA: hypothetical protein VFR07_10010 [Mycobacteriales bacterium]|nr:hypothetical protein [Mycobacteriales bacterium]
MTVDEPPGVRYAFSAGPADVGARVVLRRRLPDGRLSDVLGVVERWADGLVAVRDRHGDLVEVAAADLVAAKRVPPPPARRGA